MILVPNADLTPTEQTAHDLLMTMPGAVVSYQTIQQATHQRSKEAVQNTISNLRKKLPHLNITTAAGEGYMIDTDSNTVTDGVEDEAVAEAADVTDEQDANYDETPADDRPEAAPAPEKVTRIRRSAVQPGTVRVSFPAAFSEFIQDNEPAPLAGLGEMLGNGESAGARSYTTVTFTDGEFESLVIGLRDVLSADGIGRHRRTVAQLLSEVDDRSKYAGKRGGLIAFPAPQA